MSTNIYFRVGDRPPLVDEDYVRFADESGMTTVNISVLPHERDRVMEQLRLALDGLEQLSGYTTPATVRAGDLDDSHIGTHQVRGVLYPHSDGTTTWGEWRDIHAVTPSPFGDGIEIDCGDNLTLEIVDVDDHVQIRRRLPVDQLRTVA